MSIEQFAAALDEGVDAGVFGDGAAGGRAIAAARNWLFLLGYLKRDNEKDHSDDDLEAALALFRLDAGLSNDPAAGRGLDAPTLDALVKLVAFDPDAHFEQRLEAVPLTSPAWLRAVQLRLYALDLVERLPRKGHDPVIVEKGLERFARIFRMLDLGALEAAVTVDTIRALYTSEPVLARLRREKNSVTIRHEADANHARQADNRQLIKQFVKALASIELWLIGYLVRPRRHMWARDSSNANLPFALEAFWRDQPIAERPPKRELGQLNGRFFERVDQVSVPADDEARDNDTISGELMHDAALAAEVRKQTLGLGARLLDGVRRVARFVIGWLRRRLGGLIALARNIASVLANRVRRWFGTIEQIVLAVADCWQFLRGKPVPGSDPRALLVLHDKDFDFVLLGSTGASPERAVAVGERLLASARLFNRTAEFVEGLVASLVLVARRAGLGGWFGALLAMLQMRERIGAMRELATAIAAQRALIAAI
jgi:hypothetical protein